MPGGFHVQIDALRASAVGLGQVTEQLDQALSAFENQLASFGEPWGNDDVGMIIGECYSAVHELAMGSFESNAEVLGQFADGLDDMADGYEDVETGTTEAMRRLHSALGT
jgi:hypothetical protein